ncbi:MAG: hypothetical protein OEV64_10220 [Desulfobulbaceae bacterium]|nr:hypothetical protein [Desulfobulbaceae bacterium]
MRIAVIHYHLQSGGVNRIIQNSVPLDGKGDFSAVVLTGQPPSGSWPCPFRVIPGLQYEGIGPKLTPEALATEISREAEEALGGPPDLYHVHNHSLGKNMALPGALALLAGRGHHLFLHIHDFAEDGRPGNYRRMLAELGGGEVGRLARVLYPLADHVHYAVLNNRDYHFLGQAGLAEEKLHLLPNPIELFSDLAVPSCEEVPGPPLWFYPTRGIRRKNLGEFILWAAVSREEERFATSLGPLNPKEIPIYNGWKKLAGELGLPVDFELSLREPGGFIGLMRRARGLVTTSIAEGFGLAFLEPWLMGKVVCGRDLPEITEEFRQEGIRLSHLYRRVEVPVSWLGRKRILEKAVRGLRDNLSSYGRQPSVSDFERMEKSWLQNERVDFGCLDEELQVEVIRRVCSMPEESKQLQPTSLVHPAEFSEDVKVNRSVLAARYGIRAYHNNLLSIYKKVADSPESKLSCLKGEVLLDFFLEPERLKLLRVD